MKQQRTFDETQEPDTVFGTSVFTEQDRVARQEFIAISRRKPENIAAVQAMKAGSVQVIDKVTQVPAKHKPASVTA